MNHNSDAPPSPSVKALLPLGIFFALYLLTFLFTGELSRMPISVAFLAASVVAVVLSGGRAGGRSMAQRIETFCRGAANHTIMLMVVIFILAGAFAGSARAMGAVEATVNLMLSLLPENTVTASIFLAACFVSIAMGTSCGTIAALTPLAVGIAGQTGLSLPMLVGVVVGGAMFGDNLSFISDTTIVVTRSLQVEMKDKFKANFRLVMPVALLVLAFYAASGFLEPHGMGSVRPVEWVKVAPYLAVLAAALCGVNVITALGSGIVLAGVVGLITGSFTVWEWCAAMSRGIVSDMGELIIVSLMAGGLFEIIRFNGGISWIIRTLTKHVRSRRQAEGAIAALVAFTDMCTANNTIALIITGPIAKQTGEQCGLDPKRVAGLMDTVSCSVQSLLPYGAQLLIAAGLASLNPAAIIPRLYYPFALGAAVILAILFKRRK